MSKKIKAILDDEIQWPARCTKCGATDDLSNRRTIA